LLPPLFKTTEGVVVGFQIFAWAPKKNNKNSGEKNKTRFIVFFSRLFSPLPLCNEILTGRSPTGRLR
jgi:hypothetical protein